MSRDESEDAHSIRSVNAAMAHKVATLRAKLSLTFEQFAALSGVSKGLLVQIEQGRANPSVSTLCKIAAALGVTISDLVDDTDPDEIVVQVRQKGQALTLWRGTKGGSGSLLAGTNTGDIVNLWHWILQPGEKYGSEGHPEGTQELLNVLEGELLLQVAGRKFPVKEGGSVFAYTDKPHSYANAGKKPLRLTMVVIQKASTIRSGLNKPRLNAGTLL